MKKSVVYLLLVFMIAFWGASLSDAANAKRKGSAKTPARVHFSANIEGELEPCGWKNKKGGLARRAAYLQKARVDTLANLTVEAGNFTPSSRSRADSLKTRALVDFYRMEGYDAVTLSSRELQQGFGFWESLAAEGAPIVVANVFKDARGKKPVFAPYIVKNDHGNRLAVIGLVSESIWKAHPDTVRGYTFKTPMDMGKLIKKVAKKADHLTVIGEFSAAEADTLVTHYPQIDLVISSGIKTSERTRTVGNSVIIGSNNRGYYGNYIDFTFITPDSTTFFPTTQTLDESLPVDSTVQHFVNAVNETIKSAANPPVVVPPAVATPANPSPQP